MCECRKRPPRRRRSPARLVLIKEDLDAFHESVVALGALLEGLRGRHAGVEIEAGSRGTLYLPRIRGVL